jgi:hypothetical protein
MIYALVRSKKWDKKGEKRERERREEGTDLEEAGADVRPHNKFDAFNIELHECNSEVLIV